MKAIIYSKKSLSGNFNLKNVETPVVKEDKVLVKISYTSLNAADYRSIKMGMIPKSKIFGASIAGEVVSIGTEVNGFKPGDLVMGDLSDVGFGGLAEFVAAPANTLIQKPKEISMQEAAALPLAATTALQAIRRKGNIKEGHEVLVVGSSGGVGTFAIQLATHFGASVTGVCSTGNLEQTLSLGAKSAIDYTKEDFTKRSERYDLILVINGNYPLLGCKRLLKPSGRYVVVGGSISQLFKSIFFGWILSFGSKKMLSLFAKANTKDLEVVAALAADGKIKAVIEREFNLSNAGVAMHFAAEGHASGKVLIKIAP